MSRTLKAALIAAVILAAAPVTAAHAAATPLPPKRACRSVPLAGAWSLHRFIPDKDKPYEAIDPEIGINVVLHIRQVTDLGTGYGFAGDARSDTGMTGKVTNTGFLDDTSGRPETVNFWIHWSNGREDRYWLRVGWDHRPPQSAIAHLTGLYSGNFKNLAASAKVLPYSYQDEQASIDVPVRCDQVVDPYAKFRAKTHP